MIAGYVATVVALACSWTCAPALDRVVKPIHSPGQLPRSDARRRRRRVAIDQRTLPDAITLLGVGLAAGLSVMAVVTTMVDHVEEPLRGRLVIALERHRRGVPLLVALADAGFEEVVPLLQSHMDDGAAVVDALIDVASTLRAMRRRQAEEAARRLPVRMLLPLTLCVLPGFLALTVAPVIVDAIRTIPR